MSYKLEKPCTEGARLDFIVEYNHAKGLKIEETAKAIYALEENEILQNGEPIVDTNHAAKLAQERENVFNSEFFQTSLGWIRRKVRMKDNSQKDFLSDLLLQIKAGLELGQKVEIITYNEPDFTKELDEAYMKSLQEKKLATIDFVKECLMRTVSDFTGV